MGGVCPKLSSRPRAGIVRVALVVLAAASTFGMSTPALASDLINPLVVGAGVEQGCSGVVGYVLEFDSMLFEARSPACNGFRTFDLAFLAVIALIVISAIRFRHATARRRLELARRMVEQGLEPPADLLGTTQGSDLRRGLVLVFTGVGFLIASLVAGGDGLRPAGLIPGFIGLGYLVSHRFAIRQGQRPSPGEGR